MFNLSPSARFSGDWVVSYRYRPHSRTQLASGSRVGVGVAVGVSAIIAVGVMVGVSVIIAVGVLVGVSVIVGVGVAVGRSES